MSVTYRIYPLKVGSLPNLPKVNTTYLANQGVFVEAPLFAFLLRGSNGKKIFSSIPAAGTGITHGNSSIMRCT